MKVIKFILGTISIVFWTLFFISVHSGTPSPPIHYPGIGHDPLIAHPISMNCREAYTIMCPEYHGD